MSFISLDCFILLHVMLFEEILGRLQLASVLKLESFCLKSIRTVRPAVIKGVSAFFPMPQCHLHDIPEAYPRCD